MFISDEVEAAADGIVAALDAFKIAHNFEIRHLLNCNRTLTKALQDEQAATLAQEERLEMMQAQDQLLIDHDKYKSLCDRQQVELAQAHLKIDGQAQQIKALATELNKHI